MKQTFNEPLSRLFNEVTTRRIKDVLTCCRTVVHQYCRIELLAQTGKSPMMQTYE